MTLRARLVAAFASTAAIACAVVGTIVYERMAGDQLAHARDRAAQEARTARDVYESSYSFVQLGASTDASAAPAALRRAVEAGHVATVVVGHGSTSRVWAGAPTTGQFPTIFVSESFAEEDRALATLRRTLMVSSLLATLFAAAVGLVLARWIGRRLERAARTARTVAAGDLDARIGLRGKDEIAVLSSAVDDMAVALSARIARERRFAADAAHELRTPLAGLVAAAELLPEGRAASIVRVGVADLRRLVDQLLELARVEGQLDELHLDEVDLGSVARSARRVYPELELDVDRPATVITDLRRLERVLANLIENAFHHGAPPVTLRIRGRLIGVEDAGTGFAEDVLAHATERFVVGDASRSRGAGLGLAISTEQAAAIGATLLLENRRGGGASVELTLPDRGADGVEAS
jgi:signal transduction histidine kinase